jgi:hypothetical protein
MDAARLPRHSASLLTSVLDWADPWWDPERCLLWNMQGAFRELCPPRSVHVVPPSAWYALGLLLRDGPEDRARAEATLDALLRLQIDEPGTAWHGSFDRFPEWPRPTGDAVAFEDYDPNWRQFLGTAFALVLDEAEDRLDPALASRLEQSILLAVDGEPERRVKSSYTNIALMKAWLDVWAGVRSNDVERAAAGEGLAGKVVGRFAKTGTFDEYQSPTYYGVDLFALGLWRERSRSALMKEAGLHLEWALWRDLAELHHAGLGNLCGPWDRAYGMDMGRHVGAMGLWWWPAFGPEAAPLPDLAGSFDHSHDLLLGVPAALLGPAVPDDAAPALQTFPGAHQVHRSASGGRRISAWLGDDAMVGASQGARVAADGQHHPAVGHWRLPDGGVGWFRVRRAEALDAVAAEGRVDVSASPGGTPLVLELGGIPDLADLTHQVREDLVSGWEARGRLSLPGTHLDVRASVPVVDVELAEAAHPADGSVLRATLATSGTGEPARLLVGFA